MKYYFILIYYCVLKFKQLFLFVQSISITMKIINVHHNNRFVLYLFIEFKKIFLKLFYYSHDPLVLGNWHSLFAMQLMYDVIYIILI